MKGRIQFGLCSCFSSCFFFKLRVVSIVFNQRGSPDQGHMPFSKLDTCVRKSKLRVTKSHRTKQGVNPSSHACLSCSKPVFFPLCRAGSNTASVLRVTSSALMSLSVRTVQGLPHGAGHAHKGHGAASRPEQAFPPISAHAEQSNGPQRPPAGSPGPVAVLGHMAKGTLQMSKSRTLGQTWIILN